ncbi:hypothetical protein DCOP10_11957 [Armatimonadetes bacterium DC]|nr:hypothetical protein DCOP10_11957 [Armatimonadetes bacterium DC]
MRWLVRVLAVALIALSLPPIERQASHNACATSACLCKDCGGGAQCCCVLAEQGLEKALSLTQCDRAQQHEKALRALPRLVPASVALITLPGLCFAGYHLLSLSPVSRAVLPRDPPPRSLQVALG